MPRGETAHLAKLTVEAVIEIRNSSASAIELSQRYGVRPKAIQRVLARETWKHIAQ